MDRQLGIIIINVALLRSHMGKQLPPHISIRPFMANDRLDFEWKYETARLCSKVCIQKICTCEETNRKQKRN